MSSLAAPPVLFERLRPAQNVLIAGAGGGFDVFAGLPIALALLSQGKQVHFANLSFTYLGGTDARRLDHALFEVRPNTRGEERYFPERALASWLESRGLPSTVYAFEKVGVRPLRSAYLRLVRDLKVDAIVLVDGGTDILMFGDEAGLGTPQEDMTSLCAVNGLQIAPSFVVCIGFGVDTYHGVCHAHFLENVATLERAGAFLGAFSVPRTSEEGQAFLDAVAFAASQTPGRPSIVNGSIAAALRGDFGNVPLGARTEGSELFINPLMSVYFTFELSGVARKSLYLDALERTDNIFQVSAIIEAFRSQVKARPFRPIPH